jgi:hypothetical protein
MATASLYGIQIVNNINNINMMDNNYIMPNELNISDKLNSKDISQTDINSSRLPPDGMHSLKNNTMLSHNPMIPHRYEVETNL